MKTWTCRLLAWVAVSVLHAAEPQKLPDEAIEAFLSATGTPALAVPEKPRLARDLEEAWFHWCQWGIIDPFAERLTCDPATKQAALRTVSDGLRLLHTGHGASPAFTSRALADQCASLTQSGLKDPLILMLQGWAVHDSTRDYESSENIFQTAMKSPTLKKAPAALHFMIVTVFDAVKHDAAHATEDEFNKLLAEQAFKSLKDTSYRPEDEEILVENLRAAFAEKVIKKHGKKIREICEWQDLTEWQKLIFTGWFESSSAWLARGHDFTSQVAADGWKDFGTHMADACKAFKKAWELHPERPQAAAEMVAIVSVGGGEKEDNARRWLDRTLAAQFDYMKAYGYLLNGCLPRWGGSHQQMLALGLACARTHRYDTEVPYYFLHVLREVIAETPDWHPLCQNPLISAVTLALCRQRVQDAASSEARDTATAQLGIYAWACGDYQTAVDAFAKAPSPFPRKALVPLLLIAHKNERDVRGEAIIFSKSLKDSWEQAEDALKNRQWDFAVKTYEEILPQVDGIGHELAAGGLATARFERDLNKGGWVPLKVQPDLAGWHVQKGDWVGTPEGALINTGHGTSAYILHTGRVGPEFQLRGEFRTLGDKGNFGIMLGRGFEGTEEKWINCEQRRDGEGTKIYLADRKHTSSAKDVWVADDPSHGTFLVTCHHNCISYEINGRLVFSNYQTYGLLSPNAPLALMPDGQIGFGMSMLVQGNEFRILHPEVRLLTDTDKTPDTAAATIPSAQEVTTPEKLFRFLEGSVWSMAAAQDGDDGSSVIFQSAHRDFWYSGKETDWRKHHSMSALDARTLQIDGDQHTLKFNEDCTRFEITDWPKPGVTKFGSFKSRSGPAAPGSDKPFSFYGTTWKRGDSTIEFKDDGAWHERTSTTVTAALWKPQSPKDAVVFITTTDTRVFHVSEDGQTMTLDRGWIWHREQ